MARHDIGSCPCCAAAEQRRRDQEMFDLQPYPRVLRVKIDPLTIDYLYSSWISRTREDGVFEWWGRENRFLRSSFRFRITREQAVQILSISKNTTYPPGIRDDIFGGDGH